MIKIFEVQNLNAKSFKGNPIIAPIIDPIILLKL